VLDDELRSEGRARELVRAVNDQRKVRGFAIAERVRAEIVASSDTLAGVARHQRWIADEVLATELTLTVGAGAGEADATVAGSPVWVTLAGA
jgi:isoleucyl-tRNA synthetase